MALRDLMFTIRSRFDRSGTDEAKQQIDDVADSTDNLAARGTAAFAALIAGAGQLISALEDIQSRQDEIAERRVTDANIAAELGVDTNFAAATRIALEAADADIGTIRGVTQALPEVFQGLSGEDRVRQFTNVAVELAELSRTDPTGAEQRALELGLGEADIGELRNFGEQVLATGASPTELDRQFPGLVSEGEALAARRDALEQELTQYALDQEFEDQSLFRRVVGGVPIIGDQADAYERLDARADTSRALNNANIRPGTVIINNNTYNGSIFTDAQVAEDRLQQTTEAIDEGLIYDITR